MKYKFGGVISMVADEESHVQPFSLNFLTIQVSLCAWALASNFQSKANQHLSKINEPFRNNTYRYEVLRITEMLSS